VCLPAGHRLVHVSLGVKKKTLRMKRVSHFRGGKKEFNRGRGLSVEHHSSVSLFPLHFVFAHSDLWADGVILPDLADAD